MRPLPECRAPNRDGEPGPHTPVDRIAEPDVPFLEQSLYGSGNIFGWEKRRACLKLAHQGAWNRTS